MACSPLIRCSCQRCAYLAYQRVIAYFADNGFKYGTTAKKWYNDVKPGSVDSTSPSKDKDKLGKRLAQTGDESDFAIAFTGMLAYTALLLCLFARRKMKQQS